MVGTIEKVSEQKHAGEVNTMVFDKDHLYSGGNDGCINVWDKDFHLQRTIEIDKEYPIIALAVNSQNHLYSSGRDGTLRYFRIPWRVDKNDILLQTVDADVTALTVVENTLYTADDKGIVTKWYHNQIACQYNVYEEVRSMALEGTTLYTVRDNDVTITDIKFLGPDGLMTYTTKGTLPGRAPLMLMGPLVDGHKKWLIFITRDGKGFVAAENTSPFKVLWTKEDGHEMIINTIIEHENNLYTAGYDGKVKKWTNLDKGPKLAGEIAIGKCINTLCVGPDNTIFAGTDDGLIRRLHFDE